MKNNLIPRADYLNRLVELRDAPVIKAIVGIRRCGKSTLLRLYRDYLIASGISEENVLLINFTHYPYSGMNTAELNSKIGDKTGKVYLLLDEVQMLDSWDRTVLTIFDNTDCDIYVTGSNSVMFSSKLTTLLSGRVVSIEMFPFSYREFLEFTGEPDSDRAFDEYMLYGGFPLAAMLRHAPEAELSVLEDIYETVIIKDVAERNKMRNTQMLGRLSNFLIRNIGNLVSVKKIRDYFTSNGIKINFETVENYLNYLEESLAFYRTKRYNIKAKEELSVNDKFYLSDLGLRTAELGRRDADIGHLIENTVYLELRRRGFKVFVGVYGSAEIDFVAVNSKTKLYIQVCYSLEDQTTEEREIRPLKMIKDGYPKYIVTMKPSLNVDRDGIKEIGLRELLLGKEL